MPVSYCLYWKSNIADVVLDQVELSIQCPQPELVAYLQKHDILPQAYSPLGGTDGQKLRENPAVVKIAEKHGVHGATILISWLIKRGICVLPKSVTPSRIEANAKSKLFYFSLETKLTISAVDLAEEEFQSIEELARSTPQNRVCDQSDSKSPRV